jgi:hypothetical protein
MRRRYVYYRVPQDAVADVVAALRSELAGGGFELLRRPETADGLATLMEVYAPGAEAAEPRIAALVAPWLRGERHVEVFETLG